MRKTIMLAILALLAVSPAWGRDRQTKDITGKFMAWKKTINKGIEALEAGKNQDAVKCFREAEKTLPEMKKNSYYIGKALYLTGDMDGAIEHLSKAEKKLPDDLKVTRILASAYLNKGNHREAAPRL